MATVYLIPAPLDEEQTEPLPSYILSAIKKCTVLFAENERTARRYLKKLDRQIVIDDFEWHTIHKAEQEVQQHFIDAVKQDKTIGIISEAGCPGIADPGQLLVAQAHKYGAVVKPLVGPSSILLALMASGMNGQQFSFVGYLPVDEQQRRKRLQQLEEISAKQKSTQVFIETPYRNNQLLETIVKTCKPSTLLSIAADITGENELIQTKTIGQWKAAKPDLHKRPVIFCLMG